MRRTWYLLVLAGAMVLMVAGIAVPAAKKPATVAELALYKGTDRQRILEEGAKKEGTFNFYTSGTESDRVVDAFEKKYPFIKVARWRADGKALVTRILEENQGGRALFDLMEGTTLYHLPIRQAGLYQSFSSPSFASLEEEAITRAADGGATMAAFRLSGIGLGYNTKLITKEQIPKTYADLLDPKWRGKFPIVGSSTGASWVGLVLENYGEDFLKRMAKQDIIVHMVSGRALNDMIINGEYAFSPTIFDSHVFDSRKKGAPVDWMPLEPAFVNVGQIALSNHASHPHAALLFIDFDLSKEGAEMYKAGGYSTFNKDISGTKKYKKFYGEGSMDELKKWNDVFNRLFLKK